MAMAQESEIRHESPAVRRSIVLPKPLDKAITKLAATQHINDNELICMMLQKSVQKEAEDQSQR